MKKEEEKNKLEFILDEKFYSLEAIYGACYVFVDRAYIFLEDGGKQKVKASFRLKKGGSDKELRTLQGEFLNELLNYVLRVNLSKENKKIRQQIVEQALFSATNLASIREKCACEEEVAPAPEIGYSFEDDPLGIAVPWEEKYGKKKDSDKK